MIHSIIVNNCKDCIFNTTQEGYNPFCKLDHKQRDLITEDPNGYYVSEKVPNWCPLISNDILIKML